VKPRIALSVALMLPACDKGPIPEASSSAAAPVASTAPLASASAASSATASSSAIAAPGEGDAPAWAVGTWKGKFDAQRWTMSTSEKQGGSLGWKKDDGKQGVGPGEIEVTIDARGVVSGTLSGALGALTVSGGVESEVVTATLAPTGADEAASFSGSLRLERSGDALSGTLKASSGDSLRAREAKLSLKKP
jgi:hypothetical protein